MIKQQLQERDIILNGQRYKYRLRRNKRARRLILKVSPGGDITVVIPWSRAGRMAEEFIRSKADWLAKTVNVQRAKIAQPLVELKTGAWLPILGDVKQLQIRVDQNRVRSVYKEKGNVLALAVPRMGAVRETVARWYQRKAEKYIKDQARQLCSRVGVSLNRVAISSAKSQWGSCIESTGRVSVQWRLAQAPLGVLDYVIAHEIMHLKHRGHDQKFWAGVAVICPSYQERRRWLKENGHRLYW